LLWPLVPLAWITVFVLLVRFVFWRGRGGPWAGHRATDPRAILAERYARGEIDHTEYRERLGHLEGH
jgi:putative membrane protein